jgi:hypothetical protein
MLLVVDDVSRFRTVGEWCGEYRGRVPVQMAAGLERMMSETGSSFPEVHARLVARGSILEIDGPSAAERTPGKRPSGNSDVAPAEPR